MTPQERELVRDLFERLARLEAQPRDAEADEVIEQGLRRAPHAVYPLVQTVLLQDEALKRADAKMRVLEAQLSGGTQDEEPRGFLDNMRETLFGEPRPGGLARRSSVPSASAPALPEAQGMQQPPGRAGSFLGTAAAAAVGVIGGGLLLDGIRSMFAGREGTFAGLSEARAGEPASPWAKPEGGELGQQAGLDDVGLGRSGVDEGDRAQRSGLFGEETADADNQAEYAELGGDASDEVEDVDFGDLGDFDVGGVD
jgi:hypothetical protein